MNVNNPPVFDHVVFPDGISRVPFSDTYAFSGLNPAGAGHASQSLPRLRDYSTCKNLTVRLRFNSNNQWYQHVLATSIGSSQCSGSIMIDFGSTNVFFIWQVYVFSGSAASGAIDAVIEGWA